MPGFAKILEGMLPAAGSYRVRVGEDWRQGRAIYGGLSASLCVQAAIRTAPDLPRLRSAQFAFIGPASEELSVAPAVLRRGRSTTFFGVDLTSDGGIVARALLTFAAERHSRIEHLGLAPPSVAPPEACPDFFEDRPSPAFSRHFDMRRAGGDLPFSGSRHPSMTIWLRHRETHAPLSNPAWLVVMADAAPPAAITMFENQAPISTMTWSMEMLDLPSAGTADEWVLLQTTGLTASHGYSTQAMYLWDKSGAPLIIATQCVALFG